MGDRLIPGLMPGNCSETICVRASRFRNFYDPHDESKLLHNDLVLIDEEVCFVTCLPVLTTCMLIIRLCILMISCKILSFYHSCIVFFLLWNVAVKYKVTWHADLHLFYAGKLHACTDLPTRPWAIQAFDKGRLCVQPVILSGQEIWIVQASW
jgi:hypothetical protein